MALEVPKQSPLVLLIKVSFRRRTALRSELFEYEEEEVTSTAVAFMKHFGISIWGAALWLNSEVSTKKTMLFPSPQLFINHRQ
jgi:hypothetical protein